MSDLVEQIAKLEQRAHALKEGVSTASNSLTTLFFETEKIP